MFKFRYQSALGLGFILLIGVTQAGAANIDFSKAQSLLDVNPLSSSSIYRGVSADTKVETLKDGEGKPIITADLLVQPKEPWGAQLVWSNRQPLKKGDVVFARIKLRCLRENKETGAGSITFVIGEARDPWYQEILYGSAVPTSGLTIDLPCKLSKDYAAGALNLKLNFGLTVQKLEVSSVEWYNFAQQVTLKDLPCPQLTYRGREADAAWRKEAAARIEKLRKGNVTIECFRNGQPVAGAQVTIRQTRHAFGIGTCVDANRLTGNETFDQKYREILKENFEWAVFESEMKWRQMEQNPKLIPLTQKAMAWLEAEKFSVRGHNLIWPSKWALPPSIRQFVTDGKKEELREAIRTRIREMTAAYKGRLAEWDVINEPTKNHDLQDVLGEEAMVEWFRLAREADPSAKLFLNDYTMLSGGAVNLAQIDRLYEILHFLRQRGAQIDTIGEQAHFAWQLVEPERMLKILDRFAGLGLPIEITEFDVNITDEQLQADYTRDFMIAAYSHPSVTGVIVWGFWEGQHFQPSSALWTRDWREKPNAKVWRDLWFNQWFTKELSGRTDKTGAYTARGFQGDYTAEVVVNGVVTKTVFSVKPGDNSVRVELK